MRVIDRILELAEQKNITANRVAVECKLNASAMAEWKKGKSSPGLEAIIKIADFFEVSIDYLVGREHKYASGYTESAFHTGETLGRQNANKKHKKEELA